MIEAGFVESDIDNIKVWVDSASGVEKNTQLKNPFAQSKLGVTNKRPIDHLHDNNDIEKFTKKTRQEIIPVQAIIESSHLSDSDIIEIDHEVEKESDDREEEMDKTKSLNLQYDDLNLQEKNDQNIKHDSINNKTALLEVINSETALLEGDIQLTKKESVKKNNEVEIKVATNDEECEVVWASIDDKSDSFVENYIKQEVDKRVKEKIEAFENIARVQLMEHASTWMNKCEKIDTKLAQELEKQKNGTEIANVKDQIQEEHQDELVQVILLEKKLEEEEIMLKGQLNKLKVMESKFVQQLLEIKSIRKQNRELLKMRIKEWEDEEISNQNDQQGVSIKEEEEEEEALIESESKDCGRIDDTEADKSTFSTQEITNIPQKLENTQLPTSRAEREKCRPTRMSPKKWECEIIERNKRKRNLRFKGLMTPMGPKDMEAFIKRVFGVIVGVDYLFRRGTDIVVQFRDLIDKITVLKRVKPHIQRITVTNDLTAREEEVQKWLRDEADWLRSKGYSVRSEPMKLMINGINWIWNEVLGDLVPETI